MSLRTLIILATLIGAAPFAHAQQDDSTSETPARPSIQDLDEVVIELEGGRRVVGLLVEQTPQQVVLRISGGQQTFPKEKVTHITFLAPVLERYRDMRRQIADDDFASLVQLVLWLEQRERYSLAIAEIDQALSLEPLDRRALEIRTRLGAKRDLALKNSRTAPVDDEPLVSADEQTAWPPMPRLTREQINLIRVFEIDLKNPPKFSITHDTIDKLIAQFKDDIRFPASEHEQKRLYTAEPVNLLKMIFELRARALYDEVEVEEDPASMALFREAVHRPLIINSCATAGCHAEPGAGRLRLIRDKRFSDETVYTNFLIVDRFRLDDGTPLINYEEPAKSPFLQMAIDRDLSSLPHPVVPGPSGRGDRWKPVLRTPKDRRFEDTVAWIASMYRPRPDYPITLDLPEPPAGPATVGPPR